MLLKLDNEKRSPENRNSENDALREVQLSSSVFCGERSRAARPVAAITPPDVKTTMR